METKDFALLLEQRLPKVNALSFEELSLEQVYQLIAITINDILLQQRQKMNKVIRTDNLKKVYYLSMEFLIGKSLRNNLVNLELEEVVKEIITKLGYTLDQLYDYEQDAGLGNGGLGRLAACFFDSLSFQNYPAMGYSLLYEYGLFKQTIQDGWQNEIPDRWLNTGKVWLNPVVDEVVTVCFDGVVEEVEDDGKIKYLYTGFQTIEAIPYDIIISGSNSTTSTLRLWSSEAQDKFNLQAFNDGDYHQAMKTFNEANLITKVLYPSDNHYQGKELRLKQQYFLVSASIQNIVSEYLKTHHNILDFPKYVAIHINDTHPALAIPELIRILIDKFNLDFNTSLNIAKQTFSYTNHTVMAEALERWPSDLIRTKLPRIYIILNQINESFLTEISSLNLSSQLINEVSIIYNGEVRMANLCVFVSHTVNGVSKLHSEIIKQNIFNGFYQLYPERFTNVTNGIAYRRWLVQGNPKLCDLLDELIGIDYRYDAQKLKELLKYQKNKKVLRRLGEIKYQNKVYFSQKIAQKTGIILNPNSRFDVQVKRIHEYKRQLLNVLRIVYLLTLLEENPNLDITPQTFIFGGKAAPGYFRAKQIIELITYLAAEINQRPQIKEKIDVVYLPDYNVSIAEMIFPASEVSQQISLAGKEASGTGNMKFMINGALTFGTLDGANIEISEEIGLDNIFIFGLTANEVKKIDQRGYNPYDYYASNPRIIKVIDRLNYGFNGKSFDHISRYLLTDYDPDPFKCLADFDAYLDAHLKMDQIYQDQYRWNQKSLINIANAGYFSSDRAIYEYCENIWHIKKVKL